MNGPLISVCAVVGFLSFSVSETISGAALNIIRGPDPVSLDLEYLEYRDGMFLQKVVPSGRDMIKADWSAQIVRNGVPICEGGGTAPYDGSVKKMTPSYWTYDDCPPLRPGDVAMATWEWTDESGLTRGTSGKLVIP